MRLTQNHVNINNVHGQVKIDFSKPNYDVCSYFFLSEFASPRGHKTKHDRYVGVGKYKWHTNLPKGYLLLWSTCKYMYIYSRNDTTAMNRQWTITTFGYWYMKNILQQIHKTAVRYDDLWSQYNILCCLGDVWFYDFYDYLWLPQLCRALSPLVRNRQCAIECILMLFFFCCCWWYQIHFFLPLVS